MAHSEILIQISGYNSKDEKCNYLYEILDLNLFSLIMLSWQLNICWLTVTLAYYSFIYLQKLSCHRWRALLLSLLALFDYPDLINIRTFPSFPNSLLWSMSPFLISSVKSPFQSLVWYLNFVTSLFDFSFHFSLIYLLTSLLFFFSSAKVICFL